MPAARKNSIYAITECAALIALAVALSFFEFKVGFLGGSVDLVMVPLFILCYRNGAGYGIASGMIYGFLCVLIGGKFGYGLPSVLLDYVFAYGACGVAGLFRGKRKWLEVSALAGCVARFAVHFISGVTLYAIVTETEVAGIATSNAWLYSLIYNALYMLPNTVLAVAVMAILRYPLIRLEKAGRRGS